MSCVSGSVMVYKTSWLASSLDYADKTQLATTTERRFECSRIFLFRVLLDHRVCETMTAMTKISYVVVLRRVYTYTTDSIEFAHSINALIVEYIIIYNSLRLTCLSFHSIE